MIDMSSSQRRIKVGLFGTRGVPASYSGFETFYDKLVRRFSRPPYDRIFELTVFNRWNYVRYPFKRYCGAKVISLPAIPQKHLDTLSHTFFSLIYSAKIGLTFDVALICIVGNAPLLPLFKVFGMKTVINVDGQDWRRGKWGRFASHYLRWSEKMASWFADVVVADALEVKKYYEEFTPSHKIVYIPYGGIDEDDLKKVELFSNTDDREFLRKFGLSPGKYFLFVGRLVPENSPHTLISAFIKAKKEGSLPDDFKLALVGDAPYAEDYKRHIKGLVERESESIRSSVVFTGYLFSSGYIKISRNAFAFVLCATVGGTHPVLVEQMSLGNLVISFDTPSNKEVLGDTGIFFKSEEELKKIISYLSTNQREEKHKLDELRRKAKERADKLFSWDKIAEEYSKLFIKLSQNYH